MDVDAELALFEAEIADFESETHDATNAPEEVEDAVAITTSTVTDTDAPALTHQAVETLPSAVALPSSSSSDISTTGPHNNLGAIPVAPYSSTNEIVNRKRPQPSTPFISDTSTKVQLASISNAATSTALTAPSASKSATSTKLVFPMVSSSAKHPKAFPVFPSTTGAPSPAPLDGIQPSNSDTQENTNNTKISKTMIRKAAGKVWVDKSLADFPANDFRIFVGDLSREVGDALLARTFESYKSVSLARVVRDHRTSKSKGYGFISFSDWEEGQRALKEMNGKYCGNRPMMLRKSDWQKRSIY